MKKVALTRGRFAIVDVEWYEYLAQFKWQYYTGGYAGRQVGGRPPKRKTIYMHRLVMNAPAGRDVDHINGDKLDNRTSNLRVVDHKVNMNGFMKVDKRNSSGVRGVSKWKDTGRWRARRGGKHYGVFDTIDQAAAALEAL
jgi:hypothetical protein